MIFHVLTLFPGMFEGPMDQSIMARARDKGLLRIHIHNIRDFSANKHNDVDDYAYGGGPGMVMKPEPIAGALAYVAKELMSSPDGKVPEGIPVVLMSPQGRSLTQSLAADFSKLRELVLICGHYEGIDERVRQNLATDEISVGDYVLTGGELAAMVLIDAVGRLIPGVLGHPKSNKSDSFSQELLQYPSYTRPEEFMGSKVPDILLSGNHKEIERWRRNESLKRTFEKRPDLIELAELSSEDEDFIRGLKNELESD